MPEQKTLSMYVSPEAITLSGLNPRKDFDSEDISGLAESIRAHGIVEPLVVRPDGKKGYELVAGERRLRAAKLIKMDKIPIVVRSDITDDEVLEVMLLENLQRKDLKPLEEAGALQQLLDKGVTQEELAKRIGKSQSWISGRVRLLKLPESVQEHLRKNDITIDQALTFTPYADHAIIAPMAKQLDALVRDSQSTNGWRAITDRTVGDALRQPFGNSNYCLHIKDFTWSLQETMKHFDLKSCKDCPKRLKAHDEGGIKTPVCLEVKCFRPKLAAARKARKSAESAKSDDKQAGPKAVVDTSHLRRESYKIIGPGNNAPEWDIKACQKCDARRKGESYGSKVVLCMRPSCYEEKERAFKAEVKVKKIMTVKLLEKNLQAFMAEARPLDDNELRYILGWMAESANGSEYLKHWVKRPKDWRTSVQGVPPEDLRKALLGTVIAEDLGGLEYRDDLDDIFGPIRAYFPQLLEGELSKEEKSKIEASVEGVAPTLEEQKAEIDEDEETIELEADGDGEDDASA